MRRTEVFLDAALRERTERLALRLHELTQLGVTPRPVYEEKCESCSLLSQCMPRRVAKGASVEEYLDSSLRETEQ